MNISILPNKLFIKLFFGFWLSNSLLIIVVAVLLSLQSDIRSISPQHEKMLKKMAKKLASNPQLIQSEKISRLQRKGFHSGKPLRFYISDNLGNLLGQRHPRDLRKFVLLTEETDSLISYYSKRELYFGALPISINGQEYRLYGATPLAHPRPLMVFLIGNKLLTLALAILLSGLVCALLAWHLGKPLRVLKHSADSLAKGNLSSRVDEHTLVRRDELGDLGNAFNGMADAIELQIQSQQQLVRDISHELRTPLTRLQLALAIARKRGQQSKELSRIQHEALQLDALINELLTLSRLTISARQQPVSVALHISLQQVFEDAEFEAREVGKTLSIHLDDSSACYHQPKLLARALENVIRNAIRHAKQRVMLRLLTNDSHYILSVCDDGHGVAKAEIEAIFRPFYRTDSSRDRETGGWGLGLAIAAAAMEAQGGTISGEVSASGGLCVYLALKK